MHPLMWVLMSYVGSIPASLGGAVPGALRPLVAAIVRLLYEQWERKFQNLISLNLGARFSMNQRHGFASKLVVDLLCKEDFIAPKVNDHPYT
jgi:hypothetical protein